MHSVYFVVKNKITSTNIRNLYNLSENNFQYLGTECHSALALRLAMVAKPHIIVLDTSAIFVTLSKFIEMMDESNANCVIILLSPKLTNNLEETRTNIIYLNQNKVSAETIATAFEQAKAYLEQQDKVSKHDFSANRLPNELMEYFLNPASKTAPKNIISVFDKEKWIGIYLSLFVSPTKLTSDTLDALHDFCSNVPGCLFYMSEVSPNELLIISNRYIANTLNRKYRGTVFGNHFSLVEDFVSLSDDIPSIIQRMIKFSKQCCYFGLWNVILSKNYFMQHAQKALMSDIELHMCHIYHALLAKDAENIKASVKAIFFTYVAPSLSIHFVESTLEYISQINYLIEKTIGSEYVLKVPPSGSSIQDDYKYVSEMLVKCCMAFPDKYANTSPVVADTLFYACCNYRTKHRLNDVAHKVGISVSYLCTVFRKAMNTTYVDILSDIRIYHAKRLLSENPQNTIHNVSQIVGFDDPRYFSKVFKNTTGLTPQQYSNLQCKEQGVLND